MTSTRSANAAGLPTNDNRKFLPLDADLVETLSADMWGDIGRTCRLALVGNRLEGDDYVKALGELVDDDPRLLFQVAEDREKHRKALQRVLVLLRAADRRDSAKLDQVLSARGH